MPAPTARSFFLITATATALLGSAIATTFSSGARAQQEGMWSSTELYNINKLSITSLGPLPLDPSNRWADDPRAAALGKALFFDTRFSANGSVACASCHVPSRQFQDDLPVGVGIAKVKRRTMSLAGTAYQEFLFWDGRKDSQWSQALGPLESAAEHGSDRVMAVQLIAANYLDEYELLFGKLPKFGKLPAHASPLGSPEAIAAWQGLDEKQQYAVNLVFTNMGKAIAAFERTIPVPATRFDVYAAAIARGDWQKSAAIFNQTERNGLKVFLNEGDCVRCHDGPQFTGMRFFNLGLPGTDAIADAGRKSAVYTLRDDPFNCLGKFSDANPKRNCIPLRFMQFDLPVQLGAFKSPSLRGVAQRPPYMHNGKFATLRDVLKHYNNPPKALFGTSDLPRPRELSDAQIDELEAFLKTLNVGE